MKKFDKEKVILDIIDEIGNIDCFTKADMKFAIERGIQEFEIYELKKYLKQ